MDTNDTTTWTREQCFDTERPDLDEFYIDADGHLVRLAWPTYEHEARVTYGPSDGIIRRIRNANRPPRARLVAYTAAGGFDTMTGLAGR